MSTPVKVRIVGSAERCLEVLAAIEEKFLCVTECYPRAPTRYAREPKANFSIYCTVKEKRFEE